MSDNPNALATLLANTVREGECMVWQGDTNEGYASDNKGRLSRRVYALAHGREPLHNACHTCDNRACINPDHIYDGTQKQNIQDAIDRGRFKFVDPETIRGSGNGKATLADAQVAEIRRRWAEGNVTQQQLADEYHVSRSHISNLTRPNGFHWGWAKQ
jgi:hypothetical protein